MKRKLLDYFPSGAISLRESATDWQDAVDISMEALLQDDMIDPSYVSAIKKSTIENGPYYLVAPQIAMPHARPEAGAKGTALTLTLLQKGVVFDGAAEPVKLLLGLAAADPTSHIDAIQALCELLSDDDALGELFSAQSEKEITNLLSQY